MTNIKIISKKKYLSKNKKPNQQQIWDNIAKPWKTYVVKQIPAVKNFLKNKKGKIIDLGCGTGRNMIPNKNITYYGIDFSTNQLKQARKHIKLNNINAKLYKSKLNKLPTSFKDNTFDHGLFIASLHCIETKENRKKSLEEFHRVLKPKAKAILTVWNSTDKRFKHINNKGPIYMSWKENNIPHMRYYYLYKKQELTNLVKSIGFKILSFKTHDENKAHLVDRFTKKNHILILEKNKQ
jgi:ubiquinone/menaquinone biosynthesis C-methylase UbiE